MTPGPTTDRPRLRLAQWATGNIGTRSLRGVIEHPDLELVGLWVHSQEKAGLDAGALCGLDDIGVAATTEIDEVIAGEPDCVLYMPAALDPDAVCRLLAAGSNVVTTRGEFHHPPTMDTALRTRVEEACAAGATSVHSTGSSPGFISEAIPLVLTSIQRRLDRLLIEEFADLSRRDSPDLLFDLMGFGRAPATMGPERTAHLSASFGPSLRLVAETLGIAVDDIDATGEVAVAARDVEIAAGTITAGTVGAQRVSVSARVAGRPVLGFRATWYCTADLGADWELAATGWRVTVDGDAPLDVTLRFPFSLAEMAERTPGYTANRAVNAVAAVCAAEPGVRTSVDLPPIVARLG